MDIYSSDIDLLHHLQRSVLEKLTYAEHVSHKDLLPDGMAGNAFNYHLNGMIKQGLIEKTDQGYTLTALGKLVVDGTSFDAKRFKLRPTVGLLLRVRSNGKLLVYESSRQPMIGRTSLPHRKLRIGEKFPALARQLIEKRGLDPLQIKSLHAQATYNIRYYQHDELITHRTGQLWTAEYDGELIEKQTKNGKTHWVGYDDSMPIDITFTDELDSDMIV
ncbi:MAG: hypothetical protein AAF413_02015 [Patescibacteria group bacterium]